MALSRLPGRIVYAIAVACFGAHYLLFAAGLFVAPGPPFYPLQDKISWIAGICLFITGLSLLTNWFAKWTALLLGIVLLFRVAYIHLPRVLANIHDPIPWTSAGEVLAICGGAFALAGGLATLGFLGPPVSRPGQILFALPQFIFGAQHLLHAHFVATLIPAWIPERPYWPYGIGVAFIASALAIIFHRLGTLASWSLGLMFFLWLLIIHVPSVIASPHNGNEWTGAFVALAMAGSAWCVAGSFST